MQGLHGHLSEKADLEGIVRNLIQPKGHELKV